MAERRVRFRHAAVPLAGAGALAAGLAPAAEAAAPLCEDARVVVAPPASDPVVVPLQCDGDVAQLETVVAPATGTVTYDVDAMTATYAPADGDPVDDATFSFRAASPEDEWSEPAEVEVVVPPPPECAPEQIWPVDPDTRTRVVVPLDCVGDVDALETPEPLPDGVALLVPGDELDGEPVTEPTAVVTPADGAAIGELEIAYVPLLAGEAGPQSTLRVTVRPACADVELTGHTFELLVGDLRCTGDVERITIETLPAHGALYDADGTRLNAVPADLPVVATDDGARAVVRFVAAPGYVGPDAFTFTAGNARTVSSPATASIAVQAPPAGGGGGGGGGSDFEFSTPGADYPSEVVSAPSAPPPALPPIASAGGEGGRGGNVPRFGRNAGLRPAKKAMTATRRGVVRLVLRNDNAFEVRARLRVRAVRAKGDGPRAERRNRRLATLDLPARRVRLAAGSSSTVKVKLQTPQRRALARLGRVRLAVILTARDGAGVERTSRSLVTLRAPR